MLLTCPIVNIVNYCIGVQVAGGEVCNQVLEVHGDDRLLSCVYNSGDELAYHVPPQG